MKNSFQRSIRTQIAWAILALSVSACGKIPSAYQGDFVDSATGTRLELSGGSGTLTFPGGRKLEAGSIDLKWDALLEGKPGIYISKAKGADERWLDLYWVNADLSSKREEAGLIWYTAEVLYTMADTKAKDKVATIPMFHCMQGTVMLDSVQKLWQVGCPAGATRYAMQRSASDGESSPESSTVIADAGAESLF